MVKKSAERAVNSTADRYVRIDGPWVRNQVQEAVETFIAPAIGVANAIATVSRPQRTKWDFDNVGSISPEELKGIFESTRVLSKEERAIISESIRKLSADRHPGRFRIFKFGHKRPK